MPVIIKKIVMMGKSVSDRSWLLSKKVYTVVRAKIAPIKRKTILYHPANAGSNSKFIPEPN
jgi:hypothetical protein